MVPCFLNTFSVFGQFRFIGIFDPYDNEVLYSIRSIRHQVERHLFDVLRKKDNLSVEGLSVVQVHPKDICVQTC